jgi:hypothetical protein
MNPNVMNLRVSEVPFSQSDFDANMAKLSKQSAHPTAVLLAEAGGRDVLMTLYENDAARLAARDLNIASVGTASGTQYAIGAPIKIFRFAETKNNYKFMTSMSFRAKTPSYATVVLERLNTSLTNNKGGAGLDRVIISRPSGTSIFMLAFWADEASMKAGAVFNSSNSPAIDTMLVSPPKIQTGTTKAFARL